MSGPVWKVIRAPGTCDACGEAASERLAVGTVVDFAFLPDSAYCRTCYDRYQGRHDELNPRAVAEQRTPSLLSRPSGESDVS